MKQDTYLWGNRRLTDNGLLNEKQMTTGDEKKLSIWVRKLPLETETCFFIFANALDVFMTYVLLNHSPEFQESNQVANYFFSRWGFRGMIYFKFALVAFVTVIAQIIAMSRPRTAKWLLMVGTIIVSAVVVYSSYLWIRFSGYFVAEVCWMN